MAASNINVVVITGNLTKDPELRSTGGGTSVCELRVAVNSRRKDGQTGEWVDKPNYFDVTVWGAQGENCANYLSKGRPVAVEGRLDWREWEAKDGSGKRQAVRSSPTRSSSSAPATGREGGNGNGNGFSPSSDIPADTSDYEGAPLPERRRRGRRHPLLAPPRQLKRVCSIPGRNGSYERDDYGWAAAWTSRRRARCVRANTRGSTPRSVDYKDLNLLRRFLSDKGKTRGRRVTGLSRKHQRQLSVAVKRAREIALLPYVGER